MSAFERYIGIDYSGAETPTAGLSGLRAYEATPASAPREIASPAGSRKQWTRKALAGWLLERLTEPWRMLAGIRWRSSIAAPIGIFVLTSIKPGRETAADWRPGAGSHRADVVGQDQSTLLSSPVEHLIVAGLGKRSVLDPN